jgi:hypothetical protein
MQKGHWYASLPKGRCVVRSQVSVKLSYEGFGIDPLLDMRLLLTAQVAVRHGLHPRVGTHGYAVAASSCSTY